MKKLADSAALRRCAQKILPKNTSEKYFRKILLKNARAVNALTLDGAPNAAIVVDCTYGTITSIITQPRSFRSF
jgi:hypothetical protein